MGHRAIAISGQVAASAHSPDDSLTMATNVPRTTLVCIDCQVPVLAARALRLSLDQCAYPAARLFTDDPARVAGADRRIEIVKIPRITSSGDYSRFVLKDLLRFVDMDFVQIVQWDGYVTQGASWTDEFLDYDYIGARWWFREPGRDVGNGGFSLRSRKLLEALQDPKIAPSDPEDNAICLDHRELLERKYGIRIAPGALADRYAFEGESPSGREFGFHRVFNLPYFHDEVALNEVLDALPDAAYASPAVVTLVENLSRLGRKSEALRHGKRLRADATRFSALPANFRANLERLMVSLVPRNDPCLCGSKVPFKRCCGALANWAA
jgi:Protein of unknown function (DUF5672)/SEC-C motif